MSETSSVEPFHLAVPQTELDDLSRRLEATRWPEPETVDDWSQGAPLRRVQALCAHWLDGYDWRRCEEMLNGFGQHRTVIDGLGIHFLHVRSPERDALPMVMTHGWPGSVIEFHRVIGPLTNPVAHGGRAEDAFHLVVPSLPGYGFSDKPTAPGWGIERVADAWATLMGRLGYDRWVAQGGDWGAAVTAEIGARAPPGCAAVHLNTVSMSPPSGSGTDDDPDVKRTLELMERYATQEIGYARQQATRPQTLGYGLVDSPAGQAAWIYEKYKGWMDPGLEPEDVFGRDAMLDNVMLYWLPRNGASSARLYWESLRRAALSKRVELPVAVSIFPDDITMAPRRWAESLFPNIVHWNEVARGGHFGAFEQPDLFTEELRQAFRSLR